MDVRVGPSRRQSTEELVLLNCGAGEDSQEPLGQKEVKSVNPKGNKPWILIGRTDAEALILWPPDVKSLEKTLMLERLKAEERGDRGWDGWMTSPLQWTRTWANSRRWWATGRPGVLQSMGLQRVRHDLATEQQQQYYNNATWFTVARTWE